MKIMIMGCLEKGAFYEGKIGKMYQVSEATKDGYIVLTKEQGGKFGKVKKKDAEVVE